MKKLKNKLFILIPAVFLVAGILLSCENDLDKIKQVTYDPKAPDEVAQNLSVYYTDSGYARVQINAGLSETFHRPQSITKLKDGVTIHFYEGHSVIVSTLIAKYGEVNYATGKMFVQDSVVLTNHQDGRQLRTDRLYWNQKDSTIYSDSKVEIRSQKGIGFGSSITTKQDFSYYKLTDPVGDYEHFSD